MKVLRWWRSRGKAARFDLYVRVSVCLNFLLYPLWLADAVGVATAGRAEPWVAGVGAAVQAVACLLLLFAGLDHHLGRRARPTTRIAVAGALTAGGSAAAVLVLPGQAAGGVITFLVVAYVNALSTVVPVRWALAVGGVGCVALYGTVPGYPLSATLVLAAVAVIMALVGRATLWTVRVVWELDQARRLQASLAVAEERLRFSRDLHDVVGRTLSVVAIKSALAAELARRGRAEATDEMLEVRRIAEQSLTELRAVVGGYREAELDAELAGARSLLDSAGIRCRIVGDGLDLPAAVQGAFGWVVREGTTNVLRHSAASSCTITLHRQAGDTVTLTMVNDGVPHDRPTATGGTGLLGLTERIAALGGTVTATPEPPGRFRLAACLPLLVTAPA